MKHINKLMDNIDVPVCMEKQTFDEYLLIAQMLVEPWTTTKWIQGHSLGFELGGGV